MLIRTQFLLKFNLDLVNAKIISLIHSTLKRISISIFPFFKFVQVRARQPNINLVFNHGRFLDSQTRNQWLCHKKHCGDLWDQLRIGNLSLEYESFLQTPVRRPQGLIVRRQILLKTPFLNIRQMAKQFLYIFSSKLILMIPNSDIWISSS